MADSSTDEPNVTPDDFLEGAETDEQFTRDVLGGATEQAAPDPGAMPADFDPYDDVNTLFDFLEGKGSDPKALLDLLGVREAMWELKINPRGFFRRIPAWVRLPMGLAVIWFSRTANSKEGGPGETAGRVSFADPPTAGEHASA